MNINFPRGLEIFLSIFCVFWLEVSEKFLENGIIMSLGGGGQIFLGFVNFNEVFGLLNLPFKKKNFWFHNNFECILYSFLESCSCQGTVFSSHGTSSFIKIV